MQDASIWNRSAVSDNVIAIVDPAKVVTAFPGASIPGSGEIAEIVKMLERALDQAKSGQLVAIGLVKVRRQPMSFTQDYHTEPGSSHSLAAGVLSLCHRVGEALNE